MEPKVVSNSELGRAIAAELGGQPAGAAVERFPDGELHVTVHEGVAGAEAVVVQSLTAPVGEKLIELSLVADGCRRAGASTLTAVLPYFAYARQDKSRRTGEALGGEVIARLVSTSRFERVIAVDLHSEAATAWFGVPVEHVSALGTLAEAVRPVVRPGSVVVSPDLGGAKRADRVAQLLGLPLAIVHKSRRSGTEVVVHGVLGEVRGLAPILVDDMISTGGTLDAAVRALRAMGCTAEVTVLTPHALLVGDAIERLHAAGVRRLVHSDSVPQPKALPFERRVVGLAPLLARAVWRPVPPSAP